MKNKKTITNKFYIILVICLTILAFISVVSIQSKYNEKVVGKIYFNKPVSWEDVYIYSDTGNELFGVWPGKKLEQEEDYIFSVEITRQIYNNINSLDDYSIIFNDGQKYEAETKFVEYNKIYSFKEGIGENGTKTVGEWLDYDENIQIGKIPTTESKIKNVIYMIGDGMGENHIIAGSLYKSEELNIQSITNKSYLKTASLSAVTDSAAGATALATGYKTINGIIGKDENGNNLENLAEYTKSKGMKTGIVCTQILNHATPAGFSVHNDYRYNYDEIAKLQIESGIDLMIGGGRKYFNSYEAEMLERNYNWINEISELKNISKDEKVIGTFAEESISEEMNRTSLASMTEEAIYRLENENGFFLMIEGSCIDTYSHESNMEKMLIEMIDFDEAVGVALSYVEKHPDTLLIVTADHETGGLNLDGVSSKEQLTDLLFTSNGTHTEINVPIYAYGIGANDITKYDVIDNTSVYKFIKQGIDNNY